MSSGAAGSPPAYGQRAVSGPATPQFMATYDPGGYLSPISYPPGGARQYMFPAQQIGGFHLDLMTVLIGIAIILVLEHFRPK